MASRKTAKKPSKSSHAASPHGAMRMLHKAKDGLREFAYTAAVCGSVVGMMMLLRQFG